MTADVLGVRPDAADEDIRLAFRKLAKTCHPDLHADHKNNEERFRAIIAARDLLKSTSARAARRIT